MSVQAKRQQQKSPDTHVLAALMSAGELPRRPAAAVAAATVPGRTATPFGTRVTSLTVVMPSRNEEQNLPALLDELRPILDELRLEFCEIVVVDDGSTDGTAELARQRGARVVSHAEGLGNGAAVKRGIREARGDWILLLDGDGQHPPSAIPGMVELAERHDMVVGSRGGRGGSAHRNLANRIYNRLASYVSGRTIPDLTSGYRLLRADVAKDLVWLLPNTFSYPTTITLSMLKGGFAVAFHPIAVRQRKGRSHVRLVADGSRFFLIILRIATFYAPLRVFLPLSFGVAALGALWYAFTWLTTGRFTNMAVVLFGQATLLFALGLISEQVAALRFQRLSRNE